jgi:uncharacterized protein
VTRLGLLLWCLVFPAIGWGADPVASPPLTTRVTDLTATLSAEQNAALEASLERIERDKGAQVAILMLPTTQPESIEQFGIRLAEAWKIGRWRVNDGVIVIVAKDDHGARIEVGRALEGAVPDAVAKRIVADVMAPKFKAGDFAGGLQSAVAALAGAIGGEALPAPTAQPASAAGTENHFIYLFLALMLGGVLRSLLGLFGAIVAAVVAGWLAGTIFASWIAAIIAAAITVLFSFARGGGRGWSAGGSGGALGGGFSGPSSGGGGFSGGGGEFGGGGASGNW